MIHSELHLLFNRLKCPIKVAFGMTINKAQGQALRDTGIDLTAKCFSHGQWHVTCNFK